MKKALFVILIAIITGIIFSKFVFKSYESFQVSKELSTIYFIQQGVYSNYSSMLKNTDKLKKYTYEKIDGKYYVYVCFTTNVENIPIIEKYFKSLNYSIYVKEKNIDNMKFFNSLKEYDYLIKAINTEETIKNICERLVKKYEEYK